MKRPKVAPIRSPNLFEMGKLEEVADLMSELKIERKYSEPGRYELKIKIPSKMRRK
jgi:hypothetical protein